MTANAECATRADAARRKVGGVYYSPDTGNLLPIALSGRLLWAAYDSPASSRLSVAAYHWPPASGRQALAACNWPHAARHLPLAARILVPPAGRPTLPKYYRPRTTGRALFSCCWPPATGCLLLAA